MVGWEKGKNRRYQINYLDNSIIKLIQTKNVNTKLLH